MSARKEVVLAATIFVELKGQLEGMNMKFKLLKRQTYNYRNIAHFMHQIRLERDFDSVKDYLW